MTDGWHIYHVCDGLVRQIVRVTNPSGRFSELMCEFCGDWCEVLVKPESQLSSYKSGLTEHVDKPAA